MELRLPGRSTWPFRGHKKQKFTPKDGYRYQLMGQDLAGGHCGTFVQMRGDAKYYYEVFRWNSYHTLNCCHRCSASKVDPAVPFTEVVNAAWAAAIRSHADFEEHCKVTFWTNLLELRVFFDLPSCSRLAARAEPWPCSNLHCKLPLVHVLEYKVSRKQHSSAIESLLGKVPALAVRQQGRWCECANF